MKIKFILDNKLLTNSILYTFGSMMTPLIGLVMLPVYTENLTPSEYGIMTTVQTLVGLLQLLLLLSLHGAVTRLFYDFLNEPEKQKEYLGTIFIFVVFFSTIMSIILILFFQPFGSLLFKQIPVYPFYFILIGLSWVTSLLSLPLALFRAQEKAGLFVLINLLKAIAIMTLMVYFLIFKGHGVESVLLSQFFIIMILVVITFVKSFKYLKLSFNLTYLKDSLNFSLPLIPHVASAWIISSSDRIILEKYIEIEQLGVYSLAVQVAMVLSIFFQSVNNALVPRYTRLRKEGNEGQAKKLLNVFSIVILLFGVAAIPLAMLAIQFFTTKAYYGAIGLLPLLIIGQIIKGYYYIPVAKLFYVKKTKAIASSSSVAALTNVAINILAIPFIGIYGAIVSTIAAEFIRLILLTILSNKEKKSYI
ncbi:MAG: oligosaccharide flippase family protein [Bacillaceae bacterium]|nr:oligosaccharide flippase family protein [Bacillaceae bacterium]